MDEEPRDVDSVIIAFRADRQLAERAERAAAREGLTKAAIARRALLRDLSRQPRETA